MRLEVQGLEKRFGGVIAVAGVSFGVGAGEAVALLGPNGAGKTTTASMICGLIRPDSGRTLLDGREVRGDADPRKRALGLVPQELALVEELTARRNLRFFGSIQGLGGRNLRLAVDRGLDLVGLASRADDAGPELQRRDEAAAQPGGGPAPRPAPDRPRRADRRGRPPEPQRDLRRASKGSRPGARPSSTPPTTWKRPSGSATGPGHRRPRPGRRRRPDRRPVRAGPSGDPDRGRPRRRRPGHLAGPRPGDPRRPRRRMRGGPPDRRPRRTPGRRSAPGRAARRRGEGRRPFDRPAGPPGGLPPPDRLGTRDA